MKVLNQETQKWTIGASQFEAHPYYGALTAWTLKLPTGQRSILYNDPDSMLACAPNPALSHEHTTLTDKGFITRTATHKIAKTTEYQFSELAFQIKTTTENLDSEGLDFFDCYKIHLHLPWHPGLSIKDYNFQIPAKQAYRLTQEKLERVKLEEWKPIDQQGLKPFLYTRLTDDPILIGPHNNEENIQISILEGKSEWNTLSIHPSDQYTTITLQNALNQAKGAHFLPPGQAYSWTIEVSLA